MAKAILAFLRTVDTFKSHTPSNTPGSYGNIQHFRVYILNKISELEGLLVYLMRLVRPQSR